MKTPNPNPILIENKEKIIEFLDQSGILPIINKKLLPDFLVIGAPKAGTTAFHEYLRQHPEIFIPALKNPAFFIYEGLEPSFWGKNVVNNIDTYHSLFQFKTNEKVIGEVSPGYFPDHSAPARIYKYIPDVKLVVILRNPIERAFSQFYFNRQIGVERYSDFDEALKTEIKIMQGLKHEHNPKYIRTGLYHQQLIRYNSFFSENQILILLYDDFLNNPVKELQKTFKFIGVNSDFIPDISIKHNVTQIHKSMFLKSIENIFMKGNKKFPFFFDTLKKIAVKIRRINSGKLPHIPIHIKKRLIPIFREDINLLQKKLNRDLSHWMK